MLLTFFKSGTSLPSEDVVSMGESSTDDHPIKPSVDLSSRVLVTSYQNKQSPTQVLREMMRRDTTGLDVEQGPDGMQTMHLNGRFTHVSAAIRDEQGRLRIQCFSGYPAMETAMETGAPDTDVLKGNNEGVLY